jgi:hypothetical protein
MGAKTQAAQKLAQKVVLSSVPVAEGALEYPIAGQTWLKKVESSTVQQAFPRVIVVVGQKVARTFAVWLPGLPKIVDANRLSVAEIVATP